MTQLILFARDISFVCATFLGCCVLILLGMWTLSHALDLYLSFTRQKKLFIEWLLKRKNES